MVIARSANDSGDKSVRNCIVTRDDKHVASAYTVVYSICWMERGPDRRCAWRCDVASGVNGDHTLRRRRRADLVEGNRVARASSEFTVSSAESSGVGVASSAKR